MRLDAINGVLWRAWGKTGHALTVSLSLSSIHPLLITPGSASPQCTHTDWPRQSSVNQQFSLFIFMAPWPAYQKQYQWECSAGVAIKNVSICPTFWSPPHGVLSIFFLLFVYLKLFSFVCLFIYLFMYLFFSHWQGHITHCRNSSRQKKKLISSFTYPNVFQTCMTDFSGFLKTNLVTHLHIMKANVWKTHSHVIFQVFWHHTTVWWKDRNLISPQKSLLKILTSAMCFFLWSSVLLCQTFQWISLIS